MADGIVGGALGPQQSAENNFLMTVDFAWLGSIFSDVGEGVVPTATPTFNFQMSRTWIDSQGNEQTYLFQKTPIQAENCFGINQAAIGGGILTGSTPFYLRKPLLFRAGDEILVRVQSLQQSDAQTLQLVLFGYIEGR